MNFIYPTYFLQTEQWAKFWLEVNHQYHRFFFVEAQENDFKAKTIVYEYPWHLDEKIWYLPRFCLLQEFQQIDQESLKNLIKALLKKILEQGAIANIGLLKIDFDDELGLILGLNDAQDLLDFFQKDSDFAKIAARISSKKLQWNQTITLDLNSLLQSSSKIESAVYQDTINFSKLADFFASSKDFWQTTNQNVRRYTKKVLSQKWEVSIEKTPENFLGFWLMYIQTKDRQQFHIHSQEYFSELFQKPESRVIILRKDGEPVAAWFGYVSDNTLTYLYGGNSQYSLENYGQYLLHLIAVNIAFAENLRFYDLGGFDPNHGYGRFKENYKGNKRIFAGPIDLIFKPKKVWLIEFLSWLRNFGR